LFAHRNTTRSSSSRLHRAEAQLLEEALLFSHRLNDFFLCFKKLFPTNLFLPQSEEKTIVYVLSKKPEGITEDGDIPSPPAPVTTKPEVFFVKYKTQQEADGAISNIQGKKKKSRKF
jgi:hypothetical protein